MKYAAYATLIIVGFVLGLIYYSLKDFIMPRYHKLYGRVFEVKAFPTDEAANIFMSANPGYGVLAVVDGEVLCAPCESQGVALGEVPFAIRSAVEAA